jgi:hypothetical protein
VIELSPRARPYILAVVALVLIIIVAIITSLITTRQHFASGAARQPTENYKLLNKELADCIDHVRIATDSAPLDIARYTEVWRLCENQMYDQLLLNDFTIRRQKFEENALDERVNLWLVVGITLSGVFLSAMQLMMSYNLAKIAKTDLAGNDELVVEQGKLSLKSSVTGLLIMALSLVFFVVYVKWIYQNYDVVTQRPSNLTLPPAGKLLPGGGSLGTGTRPSLPPATQSAPPGTPPASDPAKAPGDAPTAHEKP